MADKYIALKSELDEIARGLIEVDKLDVDTLTFPEDFKAIIANDLIKKPVGNYPITNTDVADVMNYATAQISDVNLRAENIANGVTILGITGTHEGGITPTGTKYITNTQPTDVYQYAMAEIQDDNLKAENIANGVVVLGITGTHEGGITPSGTITIDHIGVTPVTEYAYANIPDSAVPAEKIRAGENILGVEGTYQGIIPENTLYITDTNLQDVYHYANAQISDENLRPENIANGVKILGIIGTHSGGITPTGTKIIDHIGDTDVTNYANANIPTEAVPASSIREGDVILGVTGTYKGIIPEGIRYIEDTNPIDVTDVATAQIRDTNLKAENICSGVTILGIEGTAVVPMGSRTVVANGSYDIADKAEVIVDIPTFVWEPALQQ